MSNTAQHDAHHDAEVAPELAGLHLPDKPDGPGAAGMLSAGIGVFALGLLTTIAEASVGVKDFLAKWEFGQGVGPLAGKTTLAVLVWLLAWGGLHLAWRRKEIDLKRMFVTGVALGILGAIGTFPTFFQAFAP